MPERACGEGRRAISGRRDPWDNRANDYNEQPDGCRKRGRRYDQPDRQDNGQITGNSGLLTVQAGIISLVKLK